MPTPGKRTNGVRYVDMSAVEAARYREACQKVPHVDPSDRCPHSAKIVSRSRCSLCLGACTERILPAKAGSPEAIAIVKQFSGRRSKKKVDAETGEDTP